MRSSLRAIQADCGAYESAPPSPWTGKSNRRNVCARFAGRDTGKTLPIGAPNQPTEAKMDEIRISANLMRELAAEPGLAFVYKEGRWKFSFWPKCRIRK